MLICTPKNLLMAAIIGVCLLQIAIVFCCAACICHKNKDKKSMLSIPPEPTYRTSDVYYTRPGSLISTLQSIRNGRR